MKGTRVMSGFKMAKVSCNWFLANIIYLGPEETGKGQLWHSRIGALGEAQVEDGGHEPDVESGLGEVDQNVQALKASLT